VHRHRVGGSVRDAWPQCRSHGRAFRAPPVPEAQGPVMLLRRSVMWSVALLRLGSANAPAAGWRQVAGPRASTFDSRAALIGGKVLIVGGYGSVCVRRFLSLCFDRHGYLPQAELYDPHRDRFSLTRPMRRAREGHTATVLAGGEVLVAGGFDGQDHARAELHFPRAGPLLRSEEHTSELQS